MRENFEQALDLVLRWEGGFVDDPADPGGATNRGITRATLAAFRGRPVTPSQVKALGRAEAGAIYRSRYWDAVRGDDLPAGIDAFAFDAAVHSGPRQAVRWLQQALGVAADGVPGPVTLAAAAAARPEAVVDAMAARRLAMLGRLATFAHFGRGWTRRVEGVRQASLRLAGSAPPSVHPFPSPSPTQESPMTDVKSFLASRTIWSNLIGLSALGLAAAGYDTSGLDAGRLTDAGLQIVAAASLIASTVFRVLATRRLKS